MLTNFDDLIGMQTNQVIKKLIRYLNRQLGEYDITLEQWNVLLTLSRESEEVNQKMLAEKAGKDPAALLRILDVLERKALVERKRFSGDRRAFSLHVTPKGRKAIKDLAPFIERRFQEIVSGISLEKIEIYVEVLKSIEKNLTEMDCQE